MSLGSVAVSEACPLVRIGSSTVSKGLSPPICVSAATQAASALPSTIRGWLGKDGRQDVCRQQAHQTSTVDSSSRSRSSSSSYLLHFVPCAPQSHSPGCSCHRPAGTAAPRSDVRCKHMVILFVSVAHVAAPSSAAHNSACVASVSPVSTSCVFWPAGCAALCCALLSAVTCLPRVALS
jgi:hypothetical protein